MTNNVMKRNMEINSSPKNHQKITKKSPKNHQKITKKSPKNH